MLQAVVIAILVAGLVAVVLSAVTVVRVSLGQRQRNRLR